MAHTKVVYAYTKNDVFSKNAEIFSSGNLVTLQGFGSGTLSLHQLKKIAFGDSPSSSGTLFHIRTFQGVPVGNYAPFGDEEEVMFPLGATFRVSKVENATANECRRIYLEDADGEKEGRRGEGDEIEFEYEF